MSKLTWYWHRLRAMGLGEMTLHARKKWRQTVDAKRTTWPEVDITGKGAFPKLPKPEDAPAVLREALKRDVESILPGRWRFFGHLEIQVTIDDPKAYTKPWTVTLRQRIVVDTELIDEICLENEQSLKHMK